MRFVVVVDTQWDFMATGGALAVDGAEALIPPMQDFLKHLDPADTAGVLFTFDTHIPEIYIHSVEAQSFPIHCIRQTAGWENMLSVDAVNSDIPVWRLEKGVFDMWEEEDVAITDARNPMAAAHDRDRFFAALRADGITDVTVIGVAADYCVLWAVDGLVERGFSVSVPAELTRGIDRQFDAVVAQDFAGKAVTVV